MEIFGYIASALIGISLGLIGGGGSILTVPLLVYIFHVQPTIATSYSLFIVGSTSLAGAIANYAKGLVNIKTALLFGISSVSTVFLTRKMIIPNIPEKIASVGNTSISLSFLTMVLFAVLMLFASLSMIRDKRSGLNPGDTDNKHNTIPKLIGYGILVGLVTGFLGAGGGFLLIPTLVLLMGLPMKEAVGTSLMIIALNSLLGFTGDIGHINMNWKLILPVTVIAITGILIGSFLGRRIPGNKLKKGFGWFILAMGTYILVKEIFL